MIRAVTVLLSFQLAGEVLGRAAGISVPGPVLGMALLLVALTVIPPLAEAIRPTAQGLLSHLSLLFVPAGVGILGHLERLGAQGAGLLLAIVISTGLAIAVGALVFAGLARLSGAAE